MAKQTIGIGSSADDGTGDPLRTAFDKTNDNFDELYAATQTYADNLGIATFDPGKLNPNRHGQKLRRTLLDVSEGTRQTIRVLVVGDSLGVGIWNTIETQMETIFQGWLLSSNYYSAGGGTLGRGGVTAQYSGTSTATRNERTHYDVSYTGNATPHDAGEFSRWGYGNALLNTDRIIIPIVKESGAGTVKIQIADSGTVSGATYRDVLADEIASSHSLTGSELLVDASGSGTLELVILEPALNDYAIQITQTTGGTVRVLDPMFEISGAPCVNYYRIGAGGNTFLNSLATANSYFATFVNEYDPDVIFIESDDNLAGYQNFLPMLSDALDLVTVRKPSVVIGGHPGIGAGFGITEAELPSRIAYCQQYGLPRRWDVVDGLALFGGIDELTDLGLNADGVHLNAKAWEMMTKLWAATRGYINFAKVRPGGDIATRNDVAIVASSRYMTAQQSAIALCNPAFIDTGTTDWAYAVTSSGSGSITGNAIRLRTGTTAGGAVAAYINDSLTPVGNDRGKTAMNVDRSLGTKVRLATVQSATADIWITVQNRTWNGAYAGALTGNGFGWNISGGEIRGAYWSGSLQYTSALSIANGATAGWQDLLIVSEYKAASLNTVYFYVNGVLLGSADHTASGTTTGPKFEITNGSDATQNELFFTPPRMYEGRR